MQKEVEKNIEKAEKFAMDSPYPKPEELRDDIYAPSPTELVNGGALR